VNLAIAGHSLQRLWVNTEQLCCFIAVQEWLEDEFMSGPGLAGRRSEPRWLGCGHNGFLSQITKFKSIRLFLGMFYKCRFDLRQTGMIFEENTLVPCHFAVYAPLRKTVHPGFDELLKLGVNSGKRALCDSKNGRR
jgi:hypothetical protein